LRTEGLDDPIHLARGERARALEPGLFSDQPEHLRLRGGEAYIVPVAQEPCLRRAALCDDKRASFVRHLAQQLANAV